MWALHKGTIVSSILVLGLSALWIYMLFEMNEGQVRKRRGVHGDSSARNR